MRRADYIFRFIALFLLLIAYAAASVEAGEVKLEIKRADLGSEINVQRSNIGGK